MARESLLEAAVPEDKIVTVPLGVDLERFRPPSPEEREAVRRRLGVPDDAFCIGLFQKDGTGYRDGMEPRWLKAPEVFLEVMSRLKNRGVPLFVLLTGPGRGFVKAGLEEIGVRFRHDLLRRYFDLAEYYWALDLYVIASRVEGGPLAFLECWASGVPVVSTRVGMPADLVRQGENGLLAEVDNPRELTEQAMSFVQYPSLGPRFGKAGRASVREYAWERVAERYYTKLYKPVLDETAAKKKK